MSLTSPKKDRVFFTYAEATSGVADNNCFMEGRGSMDFPSADYLIESDYGKMGSGEHGKSAKLQAVYTQWTYKPQRFSELAYFLSFFQGKGDEVHTIASGVYMHDLHHLPISSRILPTMGFQYGTGSSNKVINGCAVNEFSIVLARGGNGVVDASFSGIGNRHRISSGVLSENATGSLSTGDYSFSAEPLINFKSCHLFIADALEDNFGPSSLSVSGEDLGANAVEITSLINSINISGNNGMSPENQLRAGGYGLVNDWTRGDRRYTLGLNLRKDVSVIDFDSLILNNSLKAFELQFLGPFINSTHRYSLHIFFPSVGINKVTEDKESPIGGEITTEVFEDSNGDSMIVFAQSAISVGYNAKKV